jgi:hypothetical protein
VANQDVPGAVYNTETGFFNSSLPTIVDSGDLGRAGLADFGTRLGARFNNVPAGVRVFLPLRISGPSGIELRRVADPAGAFTPFTPATGTPAGLGQVDVVNGTGVAVWETLYADPFQTEQVDIPAFVDFAGQPGVGTATVNLSYAPTPPSANVASASAPIPRFADSSSARPLFTINPCQLGGTAGGQFGQTGGAQLDLNALLGKASLPRSGFVQGNRITFFLNNRNDVTINGDILLTTGGPTAQVQTSRSKTKVIASGRFSVAAKTRKLIKLRLKKAGRNAFKRKRKLKTTATLTIKVGGKSVSRTRKITIKRAAKKKH